ncbi:MAG TPA: GNAT family N-acetyltransferase [Candidatus Copromorpha excrementigallinarum]|uniref:GNAT family N-acetyltransferase n=1 Tax=Candidatus Allocopromorpha excrementigallinarum TaxID=2840742 RepID=A0A9D1L4S5_9FIRM|nr:GNAT family N-acetyltransferase [Candidatus Copromorpha excrementigallinarum]
MKDFKIRETEDYESLVPFFIENDLEFSEDEPVPTDIVKCWDVREEETGGENEKGRLIGGFVLARRQGEFIVDGIAVDPEYRKAKLGQTLLEKGIEEARSRGGKRIFLVARAPGFFRKNGFVTVERKDAPNFFECLTCPQYGVDCHPEVMRLEL